MKNRYLDLSNEQDLHRIAAARQLEVLERIEEGRSSEPERSDDLLQLPNIIDDSYIPIVGATPSTKQWATNDSSYFRQKCRLEKGIL